MFKINSYSDLNKIKYFIFDLDGVILDIEYINYISYRDPIFAILGIKLDLNSYNFYFKGKRGIDSLSDFMLIHKNSNRSKIPTISLVNKIKQTKLILLKESNLEQNIVPGVLDLLLYLRNNGCKIGLATSTIRDFVDIIIEGLDLRDFFDVILCAEDIKEGKPNPEIFQKAFKSLGGEDYREGVVFEDSISGVTAAISAGLYCVGIGNTLKDIDFVNENFNFLGMDFSIFKS